MTAFYDCADEQQRATGITAAVSALKRAADKRQEQRQVETSR